MDFPVNLIQPDYDTDDSDAENGRTDQQEPPLPQVSTDEFAAADIDDVGHLNALIDDIMSLKPKFSYSNPIIENKRKIDVINSSKSDIVNWFYEQGINKVPLGTSMYDVNIEQQLCTLQLLATLHEGDQVTCKSTYYALGGLRGPCLPTINERKNKKKPNIWISLPNDYATTLMPSTAGIRNKNLIIFLFLNGKSTVIKKLQLILITLSYLKFPLVRVFLCPIAAT